MHMPRVARNYGIALFCMAHVSYGMNQIYNNVRDVVAATVIITAGGYAAANSYLVWHRSKCVAPTCWSLWQQEKTLASLQATDHRVLMDELLEELSLRSNLEEPDVRDLVIHFLKEVDCEIKRLKCLAHWKELGDSIAPGWFYYDSDLIASIPTRIARLEFLKSLCLRWWPATERVRRNYRCCWETTEHA